MTIEFTLLHEKAICPKQSKMGDAGFDLYSIEDYSLQTGERKLFKTGIAHSLPSGYYWRIAPRSWLAYKHGIDVLAGIIDENYRGEIGIILLNTGEKPLEIKTWDRIAQYIIQKYISPDWVQVQKLSETSRWESGFGSSWK